MKNFKRNLRYLPIAAITCLLAACGGNEIQTSTVSDIAPGTIEQFQSEVGETIFFPFDSSQLSQEAMETLTRQAFFLETYPGYKIVIEGHTDERGTREYNLALGQRRAAMVRKFLIEQGIPENMITTVSYGKERPLVSCDDESCWSKNRRAVTVISPN